MALAAVAGLGLTIVTTGCSGQAATGPTARCPAEVGGGPHQITYGLVYPASGTSAGSIGAYRAGVDARLGVANAHGGVYGRTLSYAWADDAAATDRNLAAAQHLVNEDKVFAVEELSPGSSGSAAWLNKAGVPVVGTANAPIWSRYLNMFSYIDSNAGAVGTWGDYAVIHGVKKAIVVSSQLSEGSRTLGESLRASLTNAKIPVVMLDVEPKSLDLDAAVRTIRDSGADFITGIPEDAGAFIRLLLAARQALPRLKILSFIGYDESILALGPRLAGMDVVTAYLPFERKTPAHRVFLDAMADYAPQQQPAADEIALSGWLDTDVLIRGLQAAGPCLTRQTFITSLRAVKDYSAGGLLAAPVNMNMIFSQPSLCYSLVQISPDGHRFLSAGEKPLCGHRLR